MASTPDCRSGNPGSIPGSPANNCPDDIAAALRDAQLAVAIEALEQIADAGSYQGMVDVLGTQYEQLNGFSHKHECAMARAREALRKLRGEK